MKRNINLAEISDGRLYEANDLVKAGCNDCKGCSDCCHGMGSSIALDPMDIFRFTKYLGVSFEAMINSCLELNVADGIVLPNLKMSVETDACSFLNEGGRCTVHAFRPGICRLFPLGRHYENNTFRYFLQVHECSNKNRTKIKIKKWLEIPELKEYESYISDWHYFLLDCGEAAVHASEENARDLSLYVLNQFFLKPFETEEAFYMQFYRRLGQAKEWLQNNRG